MVGTASGTTTPIPVSKKTTFASSLLRSNSAVYAYYSTYVLFDKLANVDQSCLILYALLDICIHMQK